MDQIVFSNRMGGHNLLWMAAGFAIAGVVLVVQGTPVLDAALAIAVIMAVGFVILWGVIAAMGRSQVAELRRTPTGLRAEMVHIVGRGRTIDIAPDAVRGWRIARQKGAGKGRLAGLLLELVTPGRVLRMPLVGASVLDRDLLGALAPDIVPQLVAQGVFTR